MEGKYVGDGIVGYTAYILIGCNLARESRVKSGSRFGIYDIPHLRFSTGVMAFLSQCIIGVYLYGEVVACIDKLDKQRKSCPEVLLNMLAEEFRAIATYEVVERYACVGSIFTTETFPFTSEISQLSPTDSCVSLMPLKRPILSPPHITDLKRSLNVRGYMINNFYN